MIFCVKMIKIKKKISPEDIFQFQNIILDNQAVNLQQSLKLAVPKNACRGNSKSFFNKLVFQ